MLLCVIIRCNFSDWIWILGVGVLIQFSTCICVLRFYWWEQCGCRLREGREFYLYFEFCSFYTTIHIYIFFMHKNIADGLITFCFGLDWSSLLAICSHSVMSYMYVCLLLTRGITWGYLLYCLVCLFVLCYCIHFILRFWWHHQMSIHKFSFEHPSPFSASASAAFSTNHSSVLCRFSVFCIKNMLIYHWKWLLTSQEKTTF